MVPEAGAWRVAVPFHDHLARIAWKEAFISNPEMQALMTL